MALRERLKELPLVSLQSILDDFSPHVKFKVVRNAPRDCAEMRAYWGVKSDATISEETIRDARFDMIEHIIRRARDNIENEIIIKAMEIIQDRDVGLVGDHKFIVSRYVPEDIVLVHPKTYGDIILRQARMGPHSPPSIWGMGRAVGKGLNKREP